MTSVTKTELLSRLFADFKNYPRGFRRSGDFSIKEADALEQYGNLIVALESGKISPSDDEDKEIIATLKGDKEAELVCMKAWKKYIARINRPKLGSIYGTKVNTDDVDEAPVDTDLDTGELAPSDDMAEE